MLIKIDIPENPYNVRIGEDIESMGGYLKDITIKKKVFIITNETVKRLYGSVIVNSLTDAGFKTSLHAIKDGEEYKNIQTVMEIYEAMTRRKIERFTPVIGFGGGVVGDIAGFAASTYLRGLPFINIPTTLVSQVDSSIGGKTGINLESGKNLVGTFYQPVYVHADVGVLDTLDKREYISGLAEVVKHAVIKGEGYLGFLEENFDAVLKREKEVLEIVVAESVKIKGDIVARDERESGLRRVLNLGHTLGHAVETCAGYGKVRHGEAVSIGLAAALKIAVKTGFADAEFEKRITDMLINFKLPVSVPSGLAKDTLLQIMSVDKKVREGRVEFVIPERAGKVKAGVPVDEKLVKEVLNEMY